MIWHDLQTELDARAAHHLTRSCQRVPAGALDLASNDYLGLARHPQVIEAAQHAAAKYGAGARASRLVSGSSDLIEELEGELARFKGAEAALVFSSGYAANLGVISALCDDQTAMFCHKRNHASLLDACKLAGAPARFWETSDKLRALLKSNAARRKIIVCDGVFSMDGDACELLLLLDLAAEFEALIVLDDAHGTGTLGRTGRGVAEHFGVCAGAEIVTLGTLSKALGSQGGFVCGPQVLIDYLVGAARSFVYSTGLNPPAVGAALAALRLIEREPERAQKCRDNAARLVRELAALGCEVAPQPSPIVPIFAPHSEAALRLSTRLLERDLWCPAIRPPTVKRARLRLTANASWDEATLARIVAGFESSQNSI